MRLRPARASWTTLLREKELRIVSRQEGKPYAVTVITLSGQVINELDRRFWLDTPGPVREQAIAAHRDRIARQIGGMGSPARLLGATVFAARAAVALSGGGMAVQWRIPVAPIEWPAIMLGAVAVGVWLVPRRYIIRPIQPLIRLWLRHLLMKNLN